MSDRFWAWAWEWNYVPMLVLLALLLLTGCATSPCYGVAREQQFTVRQAAVWCFVPPWS